MEHARKSLRLKKYDYSQVGWYYVTICTKEREDVLGRVENQEMILNERGKIAEKVWLSLPQHHNIRLDVYQFMPDHVHGIIVIRGNIIADGYRGIARNAPTQGNHYEKLYKNNVEYINFGHVKSGSLGCVIRSFKSECTKQIRGRDFIYFNVWQRSYYDHVIRNEKDLMRVRAYIRDNPKNY